MIYKFRPVKLSRANIFYPRENNFTIAKTRCLHCVIAMHILSSRNSTSLFSLSRAHHVKMRDTCLTLSHIVQTEISIKSGIFFPRYSPNNELNICICFTQIPPFSSLLIRGERFIRILLACMLNDHEIQANLENVDGSIKSTYL